MPFTAAQLENAANAAIEYHFRRGKITSSTIQDKPLLNAFMSKEKSFPGGLDNITVRVKGVYTTTIMGFVHDDPVTYSDPQNIKTARYPFKLIHSGIQFSMHELIKNGISVTDTDDGSTTATHSEEVRLANLLEDKLEDMQEGTDRGMNTMFWDDGLPDTKLVPGVQSFVVDVPAAAATVGGIDPVANTWWRNRAVLGVASADPTLQGLVGMLQKEFRQLRRYGGNPNLLLAGSDFMDFFERELRSKGNYTMEGWSNKGTIDASIADIAFKGKPIQYDPSLDDQGKNKYMYVLDTKHIFPMAVEGESMRDHSPSRPYDKYVFYRAKTWVGGLVCDQRNCHGVYSIA